MKKQLRLDGSVDTPVAGPVLERNKDGSLPHKHVKAIHWYLIQHQLKPYAHNAWPIFRFMDSEGKNIEVNLTEIVSEYEEFKRTTHGKRQVAA